MVNHFKAIFGKCLPSTRFSAPLVPDGPHPLSLDTCLIDVSTVKEALVRRLACRKASGMDYLRTEMLLPILKDVAPIITVLFQLCWRWSSIPKVWYTAQVVPIFKKGDPLGPANFRPISLTLVLRKLFELTI